MLGLVKGFSFYLCLGGVVYSLVFFYESSIYSFRQIIPFLFLEVFGVSGLN